MRQYYVIERECYTRIWKYLEASNYFQRKHGKPPCSLHKAQTNAKTGTYKTLPTINMLSFTSVKFKYITGAIKKMQKVHHSFYYYRGQTHACSLYPQNKNIRKAI